MVGSKNGPGAFEKLLQTVKISGQTTTLPHVTVESI